MDKNIRIMYLYIKISIIIINLFFLMVTIITLNL